MKYKNVPSLEGYRYFEENKNDELWSIRIATNLNCNFLCKYCFASSTTDNSDIIFPFDKLKELIDQGVKIGLRSMIFVGTGEPMLYPKFFELLAYMKSQKVIPVLITNGSLITKKTARDLLAMNASVFLKHDSLDPKIQNYLSGRDDAGEIIGKALSALKEAGYENEEKLGLARLVNRMNIDEIPDWWRFCRKNKIFPDVERIYPIGRAQESEKLWIEEQKFIELRPVLAEIDRKEFGYQWDPNVPMPGFGCNTSLYSCYVTIDNKITPCIGMYDQLFDNNNLEERWKSELFVNFRNTAKKEGCCILKGEYCYMSFPGANTSFNKIKD